MAKRIAPHNRDIIGFLEKCHHFEWNIITNSSTFFFFVKYAANVFQWQTFRSRESNHDLSWRLTSNAMPNSKFFQELRTLMINSCARYFIESKTFIFFFCEQHQHARSFNFFFSFFPPVALIVGLSVKIILKWAWHNCKENTDKPWTMQYYALLS